MQQDFKDKVNGKVGSEYPAYYFGQQIQDLKDSERRLSHDLDADLIPGRGKPAAVAELKKVKSKLDLIESSKPKLDGAILDALASAVKELGKQLTTSYPSRTEMAKNIPDAHREYEKDVTPCIDLNGDQLTIAKKMGCKIWEGKVSRNDASKIWKICRNLQGENSDTECLRRA